MALIISGGGDGAQGSHTATGVSQVIVSGWLAGAKVQIEVDADGSQPAGVYTFKAPHAISLQTAAGTKISASVVGAEGVAAVDVSVLP